jgi:cytochrome c-type biogenesis protein CcmH/NrfG
LAGVRLGYLGHLLWCTFGNHHAAATADAADGEAWRGMGRLYTRMGRADYAKRCWAEVLRLSPEDPEAKGFLAAP